jgi:membrane-bound serine protease (ClpP class)
MCSSRVQLCRRAGRQLPPGGRAPARLDGRHPDVCRLLMGLTLLPLVIAAPVIAVPASLPAEPAPPGLQTPASPATAATGTQATLPVEATPVAEPQAHYQKAFILPIDAEISDVTLESLKRRIEQAQKAGADLLVFEMDTPGGLVSSTLAICDTIKALPQHTVAWVNTKAYSGGAIVSLACNEIVMAKRSTIGDAMPISIGTEGIQAVPQSVQPKINSPLLEELRDSARRNGYSMLLCESMIRPDMEVFWVYNSQTGEKRFVTRSERDTLFGIAQPGAASQPIDAASRSEWQYVTSVPLIPRVKQPIVANNELLTMSQNEAIAYGFARPTMVSNLAELQALYDLPVRPERLSANWSEDLVAWLTSPIVRSVLLIVALLAGYIELNHPGVLLPGAVAVVFLALYLGAPYLTGLASIWAILLVVAGLVLLLVEIFLIPSFGLVGIVGIVLVLVGLVASFIPADWPSEGPSYWPLSEYAWTSLRNGMLSVSISLVASMVGMIALSRYFQRMPYLNRLVLVNPKPQEVSLEDWFGGLPQPGQVGVAIGPLRPAGKARFGGRLTDVVAESDFIEADQQVEVVERVGNRVVVRKVAGRSDG